MSKIVVGIDGSAESRRALRWAVAESKLRAAPLTVVHAWRLPHIPSGYGIGPDIHTEMLTGNRRMAEDVVENALDELADELRGVEVTRAVVEGDPAQTLLTAAADAELLVVGSRGHGGFAGLLLGSVGQQCAHHAPCPLVIVPGH